MPSMSLICPTIIDLWELSVMVWVVILLEKPPVKQYAIPYLTFGRNISVRPIVIQK